MKYELREYDNEHYCNSIRISSDELIQWDSSSDVDTLVVCTPIGKIDIKTLSDFCITLVKLLNRLDDDISHTEYTDIGNGIYVKSLTKEEKAKCNGTQLHVPGRGYLVLAMCREGNITYVCLPPNTDYSVYTVSEMRINITVTEDIQKVASAGRWFGKRTIDKHYYRISFNPEFSGGYVDGLIYYRIGNYKIPITQQMIDNRNIYVNKISDNMPKPVIESSTSQVRIYLG